MPMLTDQQKATLLQLLADSGLSGADEHVAANTLNAPRTKTVQVPKPFTMSELMAVISDASKAAIFNHALGASVFAAVNANDRPAIALYATIFASLGTITTADRDAVLAKLAETHGVEQPDETLFHAAFPGFAYVVEKTEDVAGYGPDGNPVVAPTLTRVTYTTASPDLILEARS